MLMRWRAHNALHAVVVLAVGLMWRSARYVPETAGRAPTDSLRPVTLGLHFGGGKLSGVGAVAAALALVASFASAPLTERLEAWAENALDVLSKS